MKRILRLFLLFAVVTGIFSCKKTKEEINKATEFQMSYSSDVNVPTTGTVATTVPLELFSPEVPTTSQSRFASEQTTQDLIEDIKLTRFTITNTSGNLDFLKS